MRIYGFDFTSRMHSEMGARWDKLLGIDEQGGTMSSKREQMKAKLMAEVEAMIEEALARGEEALTLAEIEDIALLTRDQVGQSLTGSLVEQQAETGDAALPSCPGCGQPMRTKGKKGRYLRTRSGETRIERGHFYCEACGRGHFPPR
jgi:hypothetical protein